MVEYAAHNGIVVGSNPTGLNARNSFYYKMNNILNYFVLLCPFLPLISAVVTFVFRVVLVSQPKTINKTFLMWIPIIFIVLSFLIAATLLQMLPISFYFHPIIAISPDSETINAISENAKLTMQKQCIFFGNEIFFDKKKFINFFTFIATTCIYYVCFFKKLLKKHNVFVTGIHKQLKCLLLLLKNYSVNFKMIFPLFFGQNLQFGENNSKPIVDNISLICWTPVKSSEFVSWIYSGLFDVQWAFYFDNLTLVMLFVVNTVSCVVHLYSLGYMSHDPNQIKFMAYLSLFTFFMLLLITSDNFIILFLGWEGVGLCSYLLISFWYTRVQANKSAMKALIVNRISDFALTIGLIAIYFVFKSFNYNTVFPAVIEMTNAYFYFFGLEFSAIQVIAILLFFGACGKSAQIGLHTWLPDAMEGPTPVSALIHAATMVTAGVFLIIKCSFIFEYVPEILTIVATIGAITAFFAGTAGLVQNDIKKVIAYSTCSQLGYMVFSCGLSNYHVGFFHLVNHAFFKALLFLSAGAIIHSLSNEQDMRKFGGLLSLLPFTAVMLLIGSLALMGLPFLTGFYSKDLILETSYSAYSLNSHFAYWLGLITAAFTSFYSYRVFYFTFLYKTNSFRKTAEKIHELPLVMGVSLFILAVGSVFLGYVAKDLFVGLGTNFWNESIFILPKHNNHLEAEFVAHKYKLLPFFGTMFALTTANFLFEYNIQWVKKNSYNFKNVYNFFVYKWYFDVIYNHYINKPILSYVYFRLFSYLDKGVLEYFGPYGLSFLLPKISVNSKTEYDGISPKQGAFIFFMCAAQICFFGNLFL